MRQSIGIDKNIHFS